MGTSLGSDEERVLGELFTKPLWVDFLPRSVEPFPYRINPQDERTTLTSDLLIPKHGEILGITEKIYRKEELDRRMKEDFVPHSANTYGWYVSLRDFGMPPHSGFGIGVERALKSILDLNHVRDAIAYPRLHTRIPYP